MHNHVIPFSYYSYAKPIQLFLLDHMIQFKPPDKGLVTPSCAMLFSYLLYFLRYSFKIKILTIKVNGRTAEPRPPIL